MYPATRCAGKLELHSDSGYRRLSGEGDEEKGYGMRGLNAMRVGTSPDGKRQVIHLLDSMCKSHRLQIRSSYGAEMLAAAHGLDDAYPTIVTLHELRMGVLKPEELKLIRERGGLCILVTLTTDAESVFKSLTSRDLKVPTEKTLLGHVSWIRELMQLGLIRALQWCDTRDMTADGHTKGCIDRKLLLQVMSGSLTMDHPVKTFCPHKQ